MKLHTLVGIPKSEDFSLELAAYIAAKRTGAAPSGSSFRTHIKTQKDYNKALISVRKIISINYLTETKENHPNNKFFRYELGLKHPDLAYMRREFQYVLQEYLIEREAKDLTLVQQNFVSSKLGDKKLKELNTPLGIEILSELIYSDAVEKYKERYPKSK